MDQKVQINFTPLLAAAFAYENKTYKTIDELCEKHKINVEKEISNNEWKDFIAAKEGNIESRYYYKKALALICCDENGKECVYKIIKAGYRYVYTYVQQNSKCALKDFIHRFVKKE